MNAEEIKNEESLKAWLSARPEATRQSDAIAIAIRSALRALPLFGSAMNEHWASETDLTALPFLRTRLTTGVAQMFSTPEVNAVSAAATSAARTIFASSVSLSARAAFAAADASNMAAAVSTTDDAVTATEDAAYAAAYSAASDASDAPYLGSSYAAASADANFWLQISSDAQILSRHGNTFTAPLWSTPPPDWFTKADAETRAIWAKDPPGTWDFWIRWWDGVLSGQQLDWELQKAVALIPDEIWTQGPAAVAEAIRLIEERLELRRQVLAMKEQLSALSTALVQQADPHHRGHNNPPEMIDASAPIILQVNTLVAALSEAETELDQPAPDPGILRKVAGVLLDTTTAVLRYCGGLADAMLKKTAEEVGSTGVKWAIRVGGLSVVSRIEPVKDLAEQLLKFASKYFGG